MAQDGPTYVTFRRDKSIVTGLVHPDGMKNVETMKSFGDQVVAVAKKHPGLRLLLNFEKVPFLSSAALSELIRIQQALEEGGGALRVCGLAPDLFKVFEVTRLDHLFQANSGETPSAAGERFKQDVASSVRGG